MYDENDNYQHQKRSAQLPEVLDVSQRSNNKDAQNPEREIVLSSQVTFDQRYQCGRLTANPTHQNNDSDDDKNKWHFSPYGTKLEIDGIADKIPDVTLEVGLATFDKKDVPAFGPMPRIPA